MKRVVAASLFNSTYKPVNTCTTRCVCTGSSSSGYRFTTALMQKCKVTQLIPFLIMFKQLIMSKK